MCTRGIYDFFHTTTDVHWRLTGIFLGGKKTTIKLNLICSVRLLCGVINVQLQIKNHIRCQWLLATESGCDSSNSRVSRQIHYSQRALLFAAGKTHLSISQPHMSVDCLNTPLWPAPLHCSTSPLHKGFISKVFGVQCAPLLCFEVENNNNTKMKRYSRCKHLHRAVGIQLYK